MGCTSWFEPATFVTIKETVKVPSVVYVWVGFCSADELPSPKSQDHAVGVPVDRSVKVTCMGAGPPVVGVPVKDAVGTGNTVM